MSTILEKCVFLKGELQKPNLPLVPPVSETAATNLTLCRRGTISAPQPLVQPEKQPILKPWTLLPGPLCLFNLRVGIPSLAAKNILTDGHPQM